MSTRHRTAELDPPQTWVAIDVAKDLHVVLIATAKQRRLFKVSEVNFVVHPLAR